MRRPYVLAGAALLALAGCGDREGSGRAGCGIAALAGPTLLLSEFNVPNQTLGMPPATLPETLVARFAAGPAGGHSRRADRTGAKRRSYRRP